MKAAFALLLITSATLIALQSGTGSIEGRVVHYGTSEGIANVEITLTIPGVPLRYLSLDAVTDDEGRFVLLDVYPGTYQIQASKGGYVNPARDGVRLRDGGTTKTVTLSADQRFQNVDLSLVRGGVIAGRILEPDGRPSVNVRVSALPEEQSESRTISVSTNDRGEYRIVSLEPGKYRVAIGADGGLPPFGLVNSRTTSLTYFPGVTNPDQASLLTVGEGEVLTGNDFLSRPPEKTFKVSGRIVSTNGGLANARISGAYLVPRGTRMPKAQPQSTNGGLLAAFKGNRINRGGDNERALEFDGVVPGIYDLFVEAGNQNKQTDCCDIVGRGELYVATDDVQDLTVHAGGVAVLGSVFSGGGTLESAGASVGLALIPEDIRTRKVQAKAGATFTIPSVLSGRWKVLASQLDPNTAILDIRQGQTSIYEDGFVVGDRSPELFEVWIGPAGVLGGVVRNSQGKPLAAAQVFILPAAPNDAQPALHRKTTSDAAGRFNFPSVAIGEYGIFVVSVPASAEPAPSNASAMRASLAGHSAHMIRVQAGVTAVVDLVTD
jgi:hypothetical protein